MLPFPSLPKWNFDSRLTHASVHGTCILHLPDPQIVVRQDIYYCHLISVNPLIQIQKSCINDKIIKCYYWFSKTKYFGNLELDTLTSIIAPLNQYWCRINFEHSEILKFNFRCRMKREMVLVKPKTEGNCNAGNLSNKFPIMQPF